ncbi:multicopper oxidase domain-containing protein [Thiohalomonas denitrificans]|uniref:multicopper oxidase domain-containing protein n=1 Tax=Thiohalomonas denitrificans TaxID=415747 RepID=UPI0026ED0B24|nr:multicopper oxidase domain-containing protein [Thiohalomonas denitrificans]
MERILWPCRTALAVAIAAGASGTALAGVTVQCPGDQNGDAISDGRGDPDHPNARCVHLGAGDGYVRMADGRPLYMFGFSDLTGISEKKAMDTGMLAATFPAPTIVADEGDELYLTLTNVGMAVRPDLFDPHTVHYHGFPEASSIFDGVPEASVSINMGSSLTYYYNLVEPGTYMYHCHVEATEHMQMGMLGNLYIRPIQNRLPDGTALGTHVHSNPDYNADRNDDDPTVGDTYAYNDGDGSTRYDVDYAIQLGSFDPAFHDASETTQPLPFAYMEDRYAMLNGRGYPDTVSSTPPQAPAENGGIESQPLDSLIEAQQGERILLRLSNLNVTNFYTVSSQGIPMQVIGRGARILRGGGTPDGRDLYYRTSSVTLGGGEAADVLLDTTGIQPGTYFLYTTNFQYLTNNGADVGGMMTEIVIN